jgi:hypothetical protein
MGQINGPELDVPEAIDRETSLVRSAIEMVATGVAPSTTVAGLKVLEAVLEIVGPDAARRGVALQPLWGPEDRVSDVRVTRRVVAPV